jgi:GT2 family glycosyltransferase
MKSLSLSIVIPTKDRHRDLCNAIDSIAAQARLPNELLLIDQSSSAPSDVELSRIRLQLGPTVDLRWIHDPSIRGLVHAKQVGASLAFGDLVCFLEDDIVLEREFVLAIWRGFEQDPRLVGASGVVTDVPFGRTYAALHTMFHRGIFDDPRPWIYATLGKRGHAPISSHALSGGLSAWRQCVFAEVPFDTVNGFHLLEDLDFSTRVRSAFGDRLAILPAARLEHHFAPAGRASVGGREKRKVIEFITFFRTRPVKALDWLWLAWLLVGVAASAAATSIRMVSLRPLTGVAAGLVEGLRKCIHPISQASANSARGDAEPLSKRIVGLGEREASGHEQLD